jgi:hypothetical protein
MTIHVPRPDRFFKGCLRLIRCGTIVPGTPAER